MEGDFNGPTLCHKPPRVVQTHVPPALLAQPMQKHNTLGYAIVLPVRGPGFRGWFWTGFGRRPNANGPKTGPKLPAPSGREVWDWFLVHSH